MSGARTGRDIAGRAVLALLLAVLSFARNAVWRDTIAVWEDALAKAPGKGRVNYQLGRAYGEAGMREKAFLYMGRGKQLDPSLFSKNVYVAESYRRQGRHDEAVREYQKLLAQDPNQAVVRNDLGCVLHAQRKLADAGREFSEAVRIDPFYAMAYANRGVVNIERGAIDAAMADYRKAVDLQPENPGFLAKLAYAYWLKGMRAEALAAYDASLRLDPKNEAVRRERDQAHAIAGGAGGAGSGAHAR